MEYSAETSDRVHKIAREVSTLSTVSLVWVSGQTNDVGEWDGYGFVVGDGFAYLSDEMLTTMTDDELIADAFKQVNKFELNSPEHTQSKLAYFFRIRTECERQREKLAQQISRLNYQITELETRLESETQS